MVFGKNVRKITKTALMVCRIEVERNIIGDTVQNYLSSKLLITKESFFILLVFKCKTDQLKQSSNF